MPYPMRVLCLALALPALLACGQAPEEPVAAARERLRIALGETREAAQVRAALRSTREPDLLPLYEAMTASSDRLKRLFAVLALGDADGEAGIEPLRRVVRDERDAAIRGVALNHLIESQAATPEELAMGLDSGDAALVLMAGRAAIRTAQRSQALTALRPLVDAAPAATADADSIAALARLVLLAGDELDQLEPVTAILTDPRTSSRTKLVMLDLVETDRVAAARPAVERMLETETDLQVYVAVLRAYAAVAPAEGSTALAEALRQAGDIVTQVQLMVALTERPEGQAHLPALAAGEQPTVAAMAAFELSYAGDAEQMAAAASRLLQTGHPILMEFVLRRARQQPREAYVQPLVAFIRAVPAQSREPTTAHRAAATAAAVLAEIGSPLAIGSLQELLRGPYDARTRAVATGLLLTDAPAVAALAEGILDSAYEELAVDAAVALARAGDARAAERLQAILAHPDRHRADLLALASVYLLKVTGNLAPTVEQLMQEVR